MAKSFLFKTPSGKLAGFLQQGQGVIRCKATAAEANARLTVIDDAGGSCTYALGDDDAEQIWTDGGRVIVGAYGTAGGRLLFDSGPQARQAALSELAREEKRAVSGQSSGFSKNEKPQAPVAPASAPAPAEKERSEEAQWPQRRWPPPPCWPQARYRNGRWEDGA